MTEIFVEPEPGTGGDATIRVPKPPLYAALAMIVLVFALAIVARRSGLGASREPVLLPMEERAIRFVPDSSGALLVYDVNSGRFVVRLEQNSNGFIFGALRGISYRRTVARTDPAAPFALTRWGDGRITLDDPATGMHIAVNSFGPTQVASFEQLFAAGTPR